MAKTIKEIADELGLNDPPIGSVIMKKILSALLVGLLMFSVVGCGAEPLQTTTPLAQEELSEVKEKTDVEKFADKNDVSIELAESLKNVLEGMELTDNSKVGVFHYDISDVYEWKQIEDWANGQRFSAYMDMEYVWYIYVTENEVVGVRDGHGNVFYTKE